MCMYTVWRVRTRTKWELAGQLGIEIADPLPAAKLRRSFRGLAGLALHSSQAAETSSGEVLARANGC